MGPLLEADVFTDDIPLMAVIEHMNVESVKLSKKRREELKKKIKIKRIVCQGFYKSAGLFHLPELFFLKRFILSLSRLCMTSSRICPSVVVGDYGIFHFIGSSHGRSEDGFVLAWARH